jgi:protein-S-isoprenylcysteine O-methyltransferase Ste14
MAERLSPQEADRALREMTDRRDQVAGAGAPWPVIVVSCLLLLGFGIVLDQFPGADDWAGNALVAVAFALMFLARTRYVGARLGYRVAPGRVQGRWGAKLLALGLLVAGLALLVGCHAWLVHEDVAWPNTITYGGLGSVLTVLIARVMGHVLRSRPRESGAGGA